jgi:hypothetical protein
MCRNSPPVFASETVEHGGDGASERLLQVIAQGVVDGYQLLRSPRRGTPAKAPPDSGRPNPPGIAKVGQPGQIETGRQAGGHRVRHRRRGRGQDSREIAAPQNALARAPCGEIPEKRQFPAPQTATGRLAGIERGHPVNFHAGGNLFEE